MINFLVKALVNKYVPQVQGSRYAEDIIAQMNASKRPKSKSIVSDTITISVPQEQVYNTLYFECRDLFKNALQQSRLRREQLIFLDNLLDEELGTKKKYYNKKYNNICHSIYSKLKSPFFDNTTYQRIMETINTFIY